MKQAKANGARVIKARKHWKVYPPNGAIITVAVSPGTGGSVLSTARQLRQAGLL